MEYPKYLTKGGERDAAHAIATDKAHQAELAKQGYLPIGEAKPGKKAAGKKAGG